MKTVLQVFLLAGCAHATLTNVKVIYVTAQQAVFSYTVSASGGTCTLAVSQSPSFSPTVYDLDAGKFTNANQDAGGADGTRTWTVGKRLTQHSTIDSKDYSRSLQTASAYYYQFSGCGSASGFFTTYNLPAGATRGELPQVDTTGAWTFPTWDHTTRNQQMIDPHTGLLNTTMTIDADGTGGGAAGIQFGGPGGLNRPCAATLFTAPDTTQGYLCTGGNNQGTGNLYYFVPATGETRNLGYMQGASGDCTVLNPTIYDGGVFYVYNQSSCGSSRSPAGWYRYLYNGNFTAASTVASDGGTLLTQYAMNDFITNFDSAFSSISSLLSCSEPQGGVHVVSGIFCDPNPQGAAQDTYGILAVAESGDGRAWDPACTTAPNCPRIIAYYNFFTNPGPVRWGGNHNWELIPNSNLIELNVHWLAFFGPGSNYPAGKSGWTTTLPSGMTANQSPIILANQPQSIANCTGSGCGTPFTETYPQTLQIGDLIGINYGIDDFFTVTGITAGTGTTLIVSGTHSNPSATEAPGATIAMYPTLGAASVTFWNYVTDPHGASVTLDCCWGFGGHDDFNAPAGMFEEGGPGWDGRSGTPMTSIINTTQNLYNDGSPQFGAAIGRNFSNTPRHPSLATDFSQYTGQKFATDYTPFVWEFGAYSTSAALVSGKSQTYKVSPTYPIDRKLVDTVCKSGNPSGAGSHGCVDISGPGSVLCDTGSCNFQLCVAVLAGECVASPASSPGDIYINLTTLSYMGCTQNDGPAPFTSDICITNMGMYSQAVDQLFFGVTPITGNSPSPISTARSRSIGSGFAGLENTCSCAPTARSTPDGSWMLYANGLQTSASFVNEFAAKLPAFPPLDTVDRTNFVSVPIKLTNPGGIGATNAVIDFGYLESGPYATTTNYYCTSRQEKCVAGTTVSPYAFPVEGSGGVDSGLTGTACASSCTITIPVISGRVAYYQVRWRNSGNATVQTDPQRVVAVP